MRRKPRKTPKERAMEIHKSNKNLDKALEKIDKRIDKAPMGTLEYFYQKNVKQELIKLWPPGKEIIQRTGKK